MQFANKKILNLMLCASIISAFSCNNAIAIEDISLNKTRLKDETSLSSLYNLVERKDINIAVVFDGDDKNNETSLDNLQEEIVNILKSNYNVHFVKNTNSELTGKWDIKSVKKIIDTLSKDNNVDIIIPFGYLSSKYALSKNIKGKKVIAPFVYEPQKNSKDSHFLYNSKKFEQDIYTLKANFNPKNIAVIAPKNAEYLGLDEKRFKNIDKNIQFISIKESPEETIKALCEDIDGVYLLPNSLNKQTYQALIKALNSKKIVTFSYEGQESINNGVLASNNSSKDNKKLLKRIAVDLQRMLLDNSEPSSDYEPEQRLVLNMRTAKNINYSPTWKLRQSSELLFTNSLKSDALDLKAVINSVKNDNLDLKAAEHNLNALAKDVTINRFSYLPSVNLQTEFTQFDKDRAASSYGIFAESTVSYSVSFSQLLFSDRQNALISNSKNSLKLSEEQKKELELNLSAQSAIAYINLLKMKSLLNLQREFLENCRTNMKLAKARTFVGISGKEDIYRWESSLALNQSKIMELDSRLYSSKIALNKVLNRKQSDDFALKDIDLNDKILLTSRGNIIKNLETPQKVQAFADFLVDVAIKESPEIKQIDRSFDIKHRKMESYIRGYFLPEIAIEGEVVDNLHRKIPLASNSAYKTTMQVGVYANLPLLTGGKKYMQYKKAKEELEKIKVDKEIAVKRLEELVRTYLEQTISSYFTLDLKEKAGVNAQKTYELVRNKYKNGTASVTDLIDSQENYLAAEQSYESARYDFIINLIWIQRAIGKVDFTNCDKEWDFWMKKLEPILCIENDKL